MAENLAKKKRVRGGHRTSVTRIMHQAETVLGKVDVSRLSASKMTLTEKIETLTTLDDEITDLLEDEAAVAEVIICDFLASYLRILSIK